jgi:hypothetical protein
MKTPKTLTRAEFEARIAAGQKFRGAGLYEADHAPKGTEFIFVQVTAKDKRYMVRIK